MDESIEVGQLGREYRLKGAVDVINSTLSSGKVFPLSIVDATCWVNNCVNKPVENTLVSFRVCSTTTRECTSLKTYLLWFLPNLLSESISSQFVE